MNNEMPKQKDYKPLKPFKLCCMNNFPFIDADFDALNNWELLCKVSEYLNDVIYNQNNLEYNQTTLYDYVKNYFANLDIQEEIDNKLDEMAESGELADIIAQYIQLQGILAYNTLADLKGANNLTNGSFTKTYGNVTYNDGKGRFYKVRTITSGDVIDDVNIVALTNFPTLIAELIPEDYLDDIETLKEEVENIETDILDQIVIFGDSWSDPTSLDAIWGTQQYIGTELDLHVNNFAKSGAYMSGTNQNDLESQVEEFDESNVVKERVKYIVILGGINDFRNSVAWTTLKNKIEEQIEILKGYCPQAKIIFVSNCQWYYSKAQGDYWCGVHEDIRVNSKIATYNIFGTMGKEMYNTSNYFHLTQTGQKMMLSNIIATLTGGELQYWEDSVKVTNADGEMIYSTQRIQNMINIIIQLKPTTSKTFFSFANPSGFYFNYYEHRFGIVGRAKEVGICNIGYNAIAFDFSTAPATNDVHTFTTSIPLNHLD